MIIIEPETAVGWNARTHYYHRIRYLTWMIAAKCEPGTVISIAGKVEEAEAKNRKPCPKCFKENK